MPAKRKFHPYDLLKASGLGLLFYLALLCWTAGPFSFLLEDTLQKWAYSISASLRPPKLPFNSKDILLIDVSGARTIGPKNEVIVDRKKLDTILYLLRRYGNKEQVIVCDVIFDDTTAYDRKLESTMRQFPKILIPVSQNADGILNKPVIRAGQTGPASFNGFDDSFLILSNNFIKFRPLDEKKRETLPLLLYGQFRSKKISSSFFPVYFQHGLYLNSVFIHPYIQAGTENDLALAQVKSADSFVSRTLINYHDAREDLKDKKIVVIGDFKNDIHQTVYGKLPGPLILLNISIALMREENKLNVSWLFTMVLLIGLLVLRKLYHPSFFDKIVKILSWPVYFLGFRIDPRKSMIAFYVVAILLILLLDKYIEIIPVILLLNLLLWMKKVILTRWIGYQRYKRHEWFRWKEWRKVRRLIFRALRFK